MNQQQLKEVLGNIDIYLLDQLMKGRMKEDMRILDAGCGYGRNAQFFIQNNYDIWGLDQSEEAISILQQSISGWNTNYDQDKFLLGDLEAIPFEDGYFGFIISSAVLHFAKDRSHFIQLFEELIRVLRPNGILWFRMTAKHTITEHAEELQEDVYLLADGSTRYLLDLAVLNGLMEKHQLEFVDPFKTVNVSNLRTMSTVVLHKRKPLDEFQKIPLR